MMCRASVHCRCLRTRCGRGRTAGIRIVRGDGLQRGRNGGIVVEDVRHFRLKIGGNVGGEFLQCGGVRANRATETRQFVILRGKRGIDIGDGSHDLEFTFS